MTGRSIWPRSIKPRRPSSISSIDHDGALDMKEVGQRVTRGEFLAADKDKDGTLDKAEYKSIVAQHFHAANPDNDTTIDAKELRTAAGGRLTELLK
jgi:Ca2+-binding EF-hand superfamily protein